MSDSGDNVTDDTKREEQEEEDRRKQKEKEEREEKERKQKEKEEKERKQKEQDEERQRKEKEENERKEQEDSKRQEEEADREYDTEHAAGTVVRFKSEIEVEQNTNIDASAAENSPGDKNKENMEVHSLDEDDVIADKSENGLSETKDDEINITSSNESEIKEDRKDGVNQFNEQNKLSRDSDVNDADKVQNNNSMVQDSEKQEDVYKTNNATEAKQKEDEYVPLDKKWSSPKREFKGITREYSFNSPSRQFSSLSDKDTDNNVKENADEVKEVQRSMTQSEDQEKEKEKENKNSESVIDEKKNKEEHSSLITKDDNNDEKPEIDTTNKTDEEREPKFKNDDLNELEEKESYIREETDTSKQHRSHEQKHESEDKDLKLEVEEAKLEDGLEETPEEESVFVTSPKYVSTQKKEERHSSSSDSSLSPKSPERTRSPERPMSPERTRSQERPKSPEPSKSPDSPRSPRSPKSPRSPRSPRSPPPTQMTWMNNIVRDTKEPEEESDRYRSHDNDIDEKEEDTEPEQEVPKVEIRKNDTKDDEEKRYTKSDSKDRKQSNASQEKPVQKLTLSESEDRSSKPSTPTSPRRIVASERKNQRQVSKSAVVGRRTSQDQQSFSAAQAKSPRSSHVQYTPRSRPRPKTTTGIRSLGRKKGCKKRKTTDHKREASEEGRSKQREFFKAELLRLQRSLRDESSKISKPKQRSYYPFVWTSLEPYYNTYVANYLIDLCDEVGRPKGKSPEDEQARPVSRGKSYAEDPRPGYVSRNTAIGLCDPWTDLRMDRELLPRLATPASKSRKRAEQGKRTKGKKERPPKEGSTRLPKFPVVDFNTNKENATKQFLYSEVPKFRQEMAGRYSQKAPKKIETDYTRTRQDFYRMNLDKLDEIHPKNRPHMRQAYFAYLQNTPGSKKAIKECVKTLDDEPPAQKAN